jgi:AcrR family transcriptional regulator
MAKGKKVVVDEASTEEKIKEAAKKLFTQKGFAATRTRDIAEEAGINLALLNYYFRSKQKLFDLIMLENFRQFIQGISVRVYDETATIDEKIEKIVTAYIDFLTLHPDLPLFILNEIRGNPSKIAEKIDKEVSPMRSHLMKQLREAGKAGKIPDIDPFHFIANLVGLTVFPFVGRPILQRVTKVSDDRFMALMQERKKLVPVWIKAMLMAK